MRPGSRLDRCALPVLFACGFLFGVLWPFVLMKVGG